MNTENNKLIAEFMEVKHLYSTTRLETLKYHSDWNWLMQIVEKIFKDFYKLNPCPIGLKMQIEKSLIEVDIEATYNACIEFIKWYNLNK